MKRHEERCTMNPNRICGLCKIAGCDQPDMKDLLDALSVVDIRETRDEYGVTFSIANEEEAMARLREVANDCPACILSALRQHGHPYLFSFQYKKEVDAFLADHNALDETTARWQEMWGG